MAHANAEMGVALKRSSRTINVPNETKGSKRALPKLPKEIYAANASRQNEQPTATVLARKVLTARAAVQTEPETIGAPARKVLIARAAVQTKPETISALARKVQKDKLTTEVTVHTKKIGSTEKVDKSTRCGERKQSQEHSRWVKKPPIEGVSPTKTQQTKSSERMAKAQAPSNAQRNKCKQEGGKPEEGEKPKGQQKNMLDKELITQLKALAQIPAKDFEKNMREWLDRDDVSRKLEAKLRCDLISNFSGSILGKSINALSTQAICNTTEDAVITRNACDYCPKISVPITSMVLSLHKIVSEFLYAQNLRYTLSVFSAETPTPSLLSDFEGSHDFRFSKDEIVELLQELPIKACNRPEMALFKKLEHDVVATYMKTKQSLLFTLIDQLIHMLKHRTYIDVSAEAKKSDGWKNGTSMNLPSPSPVIATSTANNNKGGFATTDQTKLPENLCNFLELLLKNIWQLMLQCKSLMPSLEKANKHECSKLKLIYDCYWRLLRKVEHDIDDVKCKQVHSIEQLSRLFINLCDYVHNIKSIVNFANETNATVLSSVKGTKHLRDVVVQTERYAAKRQMCHVSQQTDPLAVLKMEKTFKNRGTNAIKLRKCRNASTVTEKFVQCDVEQQTVQPMEKTYEEWLDELQSTKSGQVFLDRIEAALYKAMKRQKKRLRRLYEIRIRHQKELFRMNYKHCSSEHICKHAVDAKSGEAQHLIKMLSDQLREYELRHKMLIQRIQENESKQNTAGNTVQPIQPKQPMQPLQPMQSMQPMQPMQTVSSASVTVPLTQPAPALSIPTLLPSMTPTTIAVPSMLPTIPIIDPAPAAVKSISTLNAEDVKGTAPATSSHFIEDDQHDLTANLKELLAYAKKHIQELDDESDRMDESFRRHLAQMRLEHETGNMTIRRLRDDCAKERRRLYGILEHFKELRRQNEETIVNLDRIEAKFKVELEAIKKAMAIDPSEGHELKRVETYVPNNAIINAKNKLFKNIPQLQQCLEQRKRRKEQEAAAAKKRYENYWLEDPLGCENTNKQVMNFRKNYIYDNLKSYDGNVATGIDFDAATAILNKTGSTERLIQQLKTEHEIYQQTRIYVKSKKTPIMAELEALTKIGSYTNKSHLSKQQLKDVMKRAEEDYIKNAQPTLLNVHDIYNNNNNINKNNNINNSNDYKKQQNVASDDRRSSLSSLSLTASSTLSLSQSSEDAAAELCCKATADNSVIRARLSTPAPCDSLESNESKLKDHNVQQQQQAVVDDTQTSTSAQAAAALISYAEKEHDNGNNQYNGERQKQQVDSEHGSYFDSSSSSDVEFWKRLDTLLGKETIA